MAVLNEKGGPVRGNKKPQPQAWMSFPTGRSGIHVNPVMITPKNKVRAEIYLSGTTAKAFYGPGYKLNWEELPTGQDSCISIYLDGPA